MSPLSLTTKSLLAGGVLLALSLPVMGQNYVVPMGTEFSVVGAPKGDQSWPALSLSPNNNIIAWEDTRLDRSGAGIGMAVLDKVALTNTHIVVVNKVVLKDQITPAVTQLAKGEAAFVWGSAVTGTPDIYLRLWRKGAFYTSDIRVNYYTKDQQIDPVITPLADGSAVIAWSSYGQDGDMWGVFARRVTAAGSAPKREFQVNQVTAYNQRNPALATLANGTFIVVWISESEQFLGSMGVFGRIYNPDCSPVANEFQINTGTNACSGPAVAATSDGGFTVVWAERDLVTLTNSWDIWGRQFSSSANGLATSFRVNTHLFGDQIRPKLAAGPTGCLAVWTSLGQDGSREGIVGRYLLNGTGSVGSEFIVNTTRPSQQLQPAVAWDGISRFLVVWSGMAPGGFDLFGQMYSMGAAQ